MGSLSNSIDIQTISKASPIEPHTILKALSNGTLPTMLLYNELGLQLFEKITYNPHYYLTNSEIDVLTRHAQEIAKIIRGSTIIELGSGALRKTSLILQAIDELGIDVDYYALDLDRKELERSLSELGQSRHFQHVRLHGLHADYNDIHDFLAKHDNRVAILWMGSSVGNFDRSDAAQFLLSLKKSLKVGDSMLIGVDHRNDPDLVQRAYNDPEGDSEAFEMNALDHANSVMGYEAFKRSEWRYEGIYDAAGGLHEVNFVTTADVIIEDSTIPSGTKIRLERSYKYSEEEAQDLFDAAELVVSADWLDKRGLYSLYLTTVPIAHSLSNPRQIEAIPSLNEWESLWKLWDTITLKMIPEHMLLCKPIDLRNPCIFYIGHIPTFLDIHLARITDGKYTNCNYTQIFERGIDPDVDDPTKCHSHSEVPETWPTLPELLEFRDVVRARLRAIYNGEQLRDRNVARAIFTVYEHEAMHAETLLYMLLQSEDTIPPSYPLSLPESSIPLAAASWLQVPATELSLGLNDVEGSSEGGFFGWDNEKPIRTVSVPSFEIQSRPISNLEYLTYLKANRRNGDKLRCPKSWTPDAQVKTVYGPVSMAQAGNWPVAASYDELAGYAKWAGGRLPTYPELRLFYDTAESTESLYLDVRRKTVNFHKWIPQELTDEQKPQIYTGVWEWTSTHFDRTPGFITSKIYPGYSEDFFDQKHNIVVGGSWATIARIAARKSFVNWYQRNYEYAWTGARLVRDSAVSTV